MKSLIDYLCARLSLNPTQKVITDILKPSAPEHVGVVLSDRLINVPPEVAPPMYRMLQEEITWAIEEKEPYTFSHYLVISKTYQETSQDYSVEDDVPMKKKKKLEPSQENQETVEDFHPENQVLRQHAMAFGDFPHLMEQATQDTGIGKVMQELGLRPRGHVILCKASDFAAAIRALEVSDQASNSQ